MLHSTNPVPGSGSKQCVCALKRPQRARGKNSCDLYTVGLMWLREPRQIISYYKNFSFNSTSVKLQLINPGGAKGEENTRKEKLRVQKG